MSPDLEHLLQVALSRLAADPARHLLFRDPMAAEGLDLAAVNAAAAAIGAAVVPFGVESDTHFRHLTATTPAGGEPLKVLVWCRDYPIAVPAVRVEVLAAVLEAWKAWAAQQRRAGQKEEAPAVVPAPQKKGRRR